MTFDNIVINPPFNGSTHIDFLLSAYDKLSVNGKLVVIQPSTWLINIRKNGNTAKYDFVKNKLSNHISHITIENYNKEFNTKLFVPFSITTIDKTYNNKQIVFECCGEKKIVNDIRDCNLIGNYETIWSILNKVREYGDMQSNHIYNKDHIRNDYYYLRYGEFICGYGGTLCSLDFEAERDYNYTKVCGGEYLITYIIPSLKLNGNFISDKPHCAFDSGRHLTDKVTDNIADTKEHLENWQHFILHNKLSLFISICLSITQQNNSKDYMPWLVDRKYTDEDIYELFSLTNNEIELIESTLERFERNTEWFKRYIFGVKM